MKIAAILPIKHHSSRVPGKNYRDFNGNPLFVYILNTLLDCKSIDMIIVDTNSEIIKNYISKNYHKCIKRLKIYNRPEHLWDGNIAMNVILENVIKQMNLTYDFFFQTHTTNPLLKSKTIEDALQIFREKHQQGFDSLFSVKQWQTRLYSNINNEILAINHDPNELLPTQDLEPLYEENSCMYVFSKETLFQKKHRIGYKPYMYVMNDIESADIDIETDFIIAETLHKKFCLHSSKVVLITGANGGIGVELCKKFKQNNWIVVGTSLDDEFKSPYIDQYISADLTKSDNIQDLINCVERKYNRMDCLINNAACQICKPIWDMTEEEWQKTYDCNVKSIFVFVKHALRLLKKNKGNIVNIGSVHSICTSNEIAAYASTKSTIVGLTKNLAIELAPFGIRVNCISPGAVDTPMLRAGLSRGHVSGKNSIELVKNLGQKHLLGRVGLPTEVANLVAFVADSSNGEFINGSNLVIDGGASIRLSTE